MLQILILEGYLIGSSYKSNKTRYSSFLVHQGYKFTFLKGEKRQDVYIGIYKLYWELAMIRFIEKHTKWGIDFSLFHGNFKDISFTRCYK